MKKLFLIFSILVLTTSSSINQAKLESELIETKEKDTVKKNENVGSQITFMNNDSTIRVDINNPTVRVSLNNPKSKNNKLDFKLRINKQLLKGEAKLVLIENNGKFELPESSPVVDENTNTDYFCDRTYGYNSPNVSVAFLLEKDTRNRILLVVNHSKVTNIHDGFYTLYRTESMGSD